MRLRGEVQKKGIKILKYASNTGININKINSTNTENIYISDFSDYNDNTYILEATIDEIYEGGCPFNSDVSFYDIVVEIANIKTNEVVFSAQVKSADRPCFYCRNKCFADMADKISKFWNNQN
ncbi:MAG: hypothetical protein R3Y43_05005 [Alphaproteobacteria bacterium]